MKTAKELGITEDKRAAIELVGKMLEEGKLQHRHLGTVFDHTVPSGSWFNMNYWTNDHDSKPADCGTVACIGGWAEKLTGVHFMYTSDLAEGSMALDDLFYPRGLLSYSDITPEEAALAIRNYLETGEAQWKEVMQ